MQNRPRFRPDPSLDDPSVEEIIRRANAVPISFPPPQQRAFPSPQPPPTQRAFPPNQVQSTRQETSKGYAAGWALLFGVIAGSLTSVLCPVVVVYSSGIIFLSLSVYSPETLISLVIVCIIAVIACFIPGKISGYKRMGTITGAILGVTFGVIAILAQLDPKGSGNTLLGTAFFYLPIGTLLGFIGGLLGMIGQNPTRGFHPEERESMDGE